MHSKYLQNTSLFLLALIFPIGQNRKKKQAIQWSEDSVGCLSAAARQVVET
ncbi:MAG: hypothetical protein JXA03_13165 [Bacteroidales bacterium]|nr:hypothetical protein [Bacteroidales bacterium]